MQPRAKLIGQKNGGVPSNGKSSFSKLFQSLSPESQHVKENQQQGETLEKLEESLQALQELHKSALTPEEQEILSAMLQMLSLQINDLKDMIQGNKQLSALFQQIEKEVSVLSTFSSTGFGGSQNFVGVEGEKFIPANPNESEMLFKQISALIDQLKIELDRTASQPGAMQVLEQVEKLIQQLNNLKQELETDQQGTEQGRSNAAIFKIESPLQATVSPVQHNQVSEGFNPEHAQSQDNSQITVTVTQDIKGTQGASRSEANAPTPTVQMNNLIEDLSEILKGSIRLRVNHEGTQLRVNISPDHLGQLDIRLTASEGKIIAQIFTSSITAKEALDLQINQLRNSLMQQGISIERIDITHQNSQQSFGQQHAHAEQHFSQQQQQKQGSSARNRSVYHEMEEEEAMGRNHLLDTTGKVNYTI